jgi:acyl-CoA synthetase (NDP forming)/GNAT superfamily N-acetyltransferase
MSRVILRDGHVAELRPVQNNDVDREIIRHLFKKASPESLYFRFFHAVREVSDDVIYGMTAPDWHNNLSLVCMAGEEALGIGSYTRLNDARAEVALLVDDRLHGKGIGTLLLEQLAQAAWRYGFKQFEAYVLSDNRKMMQVFQSSGYEVIRQRQSNMFQLVLPLASTERSLALRDTREKLATAASVMPFFEPHSVAVVGASRDSNRLGHLLFRNILDGGYRGTVYPVNPSAHSVAAVKAYDSLEAIPESIDLAIIVVPSWQVLPIIEDCIHAHARAVMVISAGFSETGTDEGLELEQRIVQRLRDSGCRLIGPNCLGLINASPSIRLNASFAPNLASTGKMAIASQSGALGIAIMEYADKIGVGVSSFVSTGNKADVSSNDLLQYWEDDPETKIIVLYLESFGNPRKFSRIARRIGRTKPILAVKSARTPAGVAVSEARLAALAAQDQTVEALFRQTGIIRLDTLQEVFDVAALLTSAPLPKGRRVAIVTNTAGGAVMTVDALLRDGLDFIGPPVDLGFEALAEGYREVLPHVLRDPQVDAVIVLFSPVGVSEEHLVSRAIADALAEVFDDTSMTEAETNRMPRKPVVGNFLMTGDYTVRYIDSPVQRIPVYPFPEQAVHALAKITNYAEFQSQIVGRIPDLPNIDCAEARVLARQHVQPEECWLSSQVSADVITSVGIKVDIPDDDAVITPPLLILTIDPDPLFGPLVTLAWMETDAVSPRQRAIRITPLTDLDAKEMTDAVLGEAIDARIHQQLIELLLRLSRLIEEVPEITRVKMTACITDSFQYQIIDNQICVDQTGIV